MMFRAIAFLTAITTTSAATTGSDIPANSRVGRSLLSKARALNNNQNNYNWVAGYSIKFSQCVTSDDYYGGYFGGNNNNNNNNNRQNYNGLYQQRLVHFKLCPTGSCDTCENGADYVIDMNTFIQAYMESKMDAQEYNCEMVKENCYCDNYNDDQVCEAQCYATAGLDYCEVEGQDGQEEFDVQEALECRKLDIDEDAMNYYYYQNGGNGQNGNYYNGNGNNNNNNNNKMEFFVGPYCSTDGKSIFLGVFMDETCSYDAPSGLYEKMNYGQALPYSSTSLIDQSCVSCKEPQDYDENNNGDQQDEDEVIEVCERLYEDAGKCESNLQNVYYKNTMACEFIEGLKPTGKTRSMNFASVKALTPKILAGVFAASTVAFGGVAYYFHKKAQRTNVSLNYGAGGQIS